MTKEQALAMLKFIAELYQIVSTPAPESVVPQPNHNTVDDTK